MEKSNLLLPNNNFQYLEDINKNTEFKMCMNNLIEYTNEVVYLDDGCIARVNSQEELEIKTISNNSYAYRII